MKISSCNGMIIHTWLIYDMPFPHIGYRSDWFVAYWQCYQYKVSFIVSKTQPPFVSTNFQWKDDAHATCVWYMPINFHMRSQMLKFFTQEREQTPWTTHHPMWAHGAPLWEICPCWPINPTQLHQRGCTLDEHRPQPPWTNANVEVVGPFDTKKSKSKFHVSKRTTMLIHGFCDSISGVKHRALLSNYLNWIMILE